MFCYSHKYFSSAPLYSAGSNVKQIMENGKSSTRVLSALFKYVTIQSYQHTSISSRKTTPR
jgi:hypothetical protein